MPTRNGRAWAHAAARAVLLAAAVILPLSTAVPRTTATEVTEPFSESVVATDLGQPTAFAVVPVGFLAGDIYVAAKSGTLFLVPGNGGGDPAPALDLTGSTCDQGERGLLGVALDPAFGDNRRVYLYLSERGGSNCFNRVYRYVANPDGTLDPATRTRLLSTARLGPSNHNAGDLAFDAAGRLYVSVGENGHPERAPKRDTFFGKILRITTDGQPAPGNDQVGGRSARCAKKGRTRSGRRCAEIFARGLRNPFRIAFDRRTGILFINDVGQDAWEEIDRADPAVPGADFGWPKREGFCPQGEECALSSPATGRTDPVFTYPHTGPGCTSITGGAFVPADAGWGAFDGDYLYADVCKGWIRSLDDPLGTPMTGQELASATGGVVTLRFDPTRTGELLYTTFDHGGELRRITAS